MKLNARMPESLKPYFDVEIKEYQKHYKKEWYADSWKNLERAHVIGQAYPLEHTYIHWKMLLFGFRTKDLREILGQIPRLIVGGIKSFVGEIPVGNTGGANIPPLRKIPVEKDILEIFERAGVK